MSENSVMVLRRAPPGFLKYLTQPGNGGMFRTQQSYPIHLKTKTKRTLCLGTSDDSNIIDLIQTSLTRSIYEDADIEFFHS